MQEKTLSVFARRLQQLRKDRGWSQPELAEKIGTSGTIIGRYERGDMTPSIEVARKLAEVFEVTLDYLATEHDIPDILKDQEMLSRWRNLEALSEEDRRQILNVIDAFVRDAKARETYKVGS